MERTAVLKTGETILLRGPAVTDAGACLEYLSAVATETDFLLQSAERVASLTVEREEAFLQSRIDNPYDLNVLGFIDGELVTMFNAEASPNPRIGHVAEVAIAVKKAHWGKGIGALAFEVMLDWARERGIRMLRLGVFAHNTRAQALYRKMGFAQCGRHADAFLVNGQYIDEILMERRV